MSQSDKRTAILDATLDLIVERGFHNTPMSLIASHAGLSAGIIYHYFANKDDLIHQLYKHTKIKLGEALWTDDLLTLPFEELLKAIWLRLFRFYVTHPKQTRYLEQYENSPYCEPLTVADYSEQFKVLAQVIQDGMDNGRMKPLSYPVLYSMTFALVAHIAKQQINGLIDLDEAELNVIAEAICSAVLA